jgi:CheY-like chemotaxis protein
MLNWSPDIMLNWSPDIMLRDNLGSANIFSSLHGGKKAPLRITGIKGHPGPSMTQGNGQRVLVVDDEMIIADSLAEILSDHGYNALALYKGHAAVAAARERCPDIVICDVVMPQFNGVDTGKAIRELCPHTRILLFSGQAGITDILKGAREEGHLFEVLGKPIHPNELLKRLALRRE